MWSHHVDVSKQQRHKGHQKEQNASCRKGSKGNQQEERQQQTTATTKMAATSRMTSFNNQLHYINHFFYFICNKQSSGSAECTTCVGWSQITCAEACQDLEHLNRLASQLVRAPFFKLINLIILCLPGSGSAFSKR